MTRSKAIAKYCLKCCGDSYKEVTFCEDFNCPLWPYRFGARRSLGSKEFKQRMERARRSDPERFEELKKSYLSFAENIRNKKILEPLEHLLFKNSSASIQDHS